MSPSKGYDLSLEEESGRRLVSARTEVLDFETLFVVEIGCNCSFRREAGLAAELVSIGC